MKAPRLRVGQVTGAFGTDGAVKVLPLTDFEDRFQVGSELILEGAPRRVEWARRQPGRLVVKLAGLDDRTRAAQERGRYLEVIADQPRPLPEGSYYHHQLVGLSVVSAGGRDLGRLAEVLERPANDVWVARREDGEEVLVPATKEAVLAVDPDRSRVVVADWVTDLEEA